MKCSYIQMIVLIVLLEFYHTPLIGQSYRDQEIIDSIMVLFMGTFEIRTRYLMIYELDTICIDVYPGEFSAHYMIPFPNGISDGDTIPISFYQLYKKRKRVYKYFDTQIPIRYLKNKSVLYVTTDVIVSSQPYSGYYDWLSYFWYK